MENGILTNVLQLAGGSSLLNIKLSVSVADGLDAITVIPTTGTNPSSIRVNNTGGNFSFGKENSAGTQFGATAYASVFYSTGARTIEFFTNSVKRVLIDSASPAMTIGISTSAITQLTLDSVVTSGNAIINHNRNSVLVWQQGIDATAASGAKTTVTDFFWYAAGAYVASLTTAGALKIASSLTVMAGGATITAGDLVTSAGTITATKAGIATTITTGMTVLNSTAATAGVTVQYSPSLVLSGRAWDTDDLVSRNAAFHMYVVPTSAATVLGDLIFAWETPVGGALSTRFTFTSGGVLTAIGSVTAPSITATAGNLSTTALVRHGTSGTSWNLGVGDGLANLLRNGAAVGVGFDAATADTLKIRNILHTLYADLHAKLILANVGTVITAGGVQAIGLSSTTTFGIFPGSGASTAAAAKGSLYLRSDGSGTNDRAYINTDGGTTWTPLVTVA